MTNLFIFLLFSLSCVLLPLGVEKFGLFSITFILAAIFFRYVWKYSSFVFFRVLLIGYLSSNVSDLFRIYLGDSQGDAENFFNVLKEGSFADILLYYNLLENSFPIFIWHNFISLMNSLGYTYAHHVPVLMNIVVMGVSALILQNISLSLFGYDNYRRGRLITFFTFNGFVWMFSGMLLRDSFIFFLMTLSILVCLNLLRRRLTLFNLIILLSSSLILSVLFYFTRGEFALMPWIFFIIAIFIKLKGQYSKYIFTSVFLVFCIVLFQFSSLGDVVTERSKLINETYVGGSELESTRSSVGMAVLVEAPTVVRLFFGPIILLFFPVPFWSNLESLQVYYYYKFFSLFSMVLFLIPSSLLAFKLLVRSKNDLNKDFLKFLSFSLLLSLAMISLTSMENRHFAGFFPLFFLQGIQPDFRLLKNKQNFMELRKLVLVIIFMLTVAWAILKILI